MFNVRCSNLIHCKKKSHLLKFFRRLQKLFFSFLKYRVRSKNLSSHSNSLCSFLSSRYHVNLFCLPDMNLFHLTQTLHGNSTFSSTWIQAISKHVRNALWESIFYSVQNCLQLTHYSPVLLFYNPCKHQKTFRFSVFRGYRKGLKLMIIISLVRPGVISQERRTLR